MQAGEGRRPLMAASAVVGASSVPAPLASHQELSDGGQRHPDPHRPSRNEEEHRGARRRVAAGDQTTYNNKVKELLLDGVFGHDYFYEDAQAFNIFRVNLISNDSGVSQRVYDEKGTPSDGSDDTIVSTTLKDTALGYIFSGSWAHCWLEGGANTATLVQNALNTWVPGLRPGPDHPQRARLRRMRRRRLSDCDAGVELVGHGARVRPRHRRARRRVLPAAVPTGRRAGRGERHGQHEPEHAEMATVRQSSHAGSERHQPDRRHRHLHRLEPGAAAAGLEQRSERRSVRRRRVQRDTGLYRPVINCRMRGNSPPYCPVCYTQLKTLMHPFSGHSFLNCYAGDFNGDGKDDLLVHNGNSIMLFRSNGAQLDLVFSAVERVPGLLAVPAGRSVLHRRLQRRRQGRGRGLQQHELGHGVPGPARRRRQQRAEARSRGTTMRCPAGSSI